jgi:hypothetical protein
MKLVVLNFDNKRIGNSRCSWSSESRSVVYARLSNSGKMPRYELAVIYRLMERVGILNLRAQTYPPMHWITLGSNCAKILCGVVLFRIVSFAECLIVGRVHFANEFAD